MWIAPVATPSLRELALPCFDQEQDNRVGGMNGNAAIRGINTGVAPFAGVSVSGVSTEGPTPGMAVKARQGGPNVAGYQRGEVVRITIAG